MLRKHKLLRTKSSHVKAGMTLVELIVVLSIFAIISTIVIINYNDSKSRASLYNLAEDIGLSIRRAQSRAIGIQVTDIAGAEQSRGYGIHFSTEQVIASTGDGSGGAPLPQCSDTTDNDGDGLIDNSDPSCYADPLNPATYDANLDDEGFTSGGGGPVTQCSDTIDNDLDLFTDSGDPSCWTDPSNPATYDANLNDEFIVTPPPPVAYIPILNSLNNFFTNTIQHVFADTGSDSVTGNSKSIIFFTDLVCTGDTPNKEYDYPGKPDMQVFPCNPNPSTTPVCDRANLGPGNECTDILNIKSTDTVSAICINAPDEICSQPPGEVAALDIVFIRPNPDAYFCYTQPVPPGGPSAPCINSGISNAEIVVKSQAGDTRTITVWNTGQISVK